MKKLILCVSICLLIISGCSFHKKSQSIKNVQHHEILAKCTDLPDAPFQLSLLDVVTSSDNDQMQFFYTFTGMKDDIIVFYEQQMERLGWDIKAQSNLQDYFILFNKPYKNCAILIQQNKVTIYFCHKKSA
ncbi:MAG: hypothetical protein ACXWL5_00440 [Candidatus Chromulinivorax sp.]